MSNLNPIAFVDYENYPQFFEKESSLDYLKIYIFVGFRQKQFPIEFCKWLLKAGKRVEIIEMTKQGRNSLDFRLIFQLGICHQKYPKEVGFTIFSNDRDFDSLIKYLSNGLIRQVVRIGLTS